MRIAVSIAVLLAAAPSPAAAAIAAYAEAPGGATVAAVDPDTAINPASVVKLATSLWALERLGAGHRFETAFEVTGALDPATGRLDGDLIVRGGADPDFHAENAFLVARALTAAGVRTVAGDLVVTGPFWIGWEGGSEKRLPEPARSRLMARRLLEALDARRFKPETRRTWERFRERRGLGDEPPPEIRIRGRAVVRATPPAGRPLVVHRSNPLARTLERFNAWSNNDIERLGTSLGSAEDLGGFLAARWHLDGAARFDTLSGLDSNRMSPRTVVRLLRDLESTVARVGLDVSDLMAVGGCDPGTLRHFPALDRGALARAVTAKTGTLVHTDGGVSVLAGFADTPEGRIAFCVAVPGSGNEIDAARRAEERWIVDLVAAHGGPAPVPCGASPGYSDDDARVTVDQKGLSLPEAVR